MRSQPTFRDIHRGTNITSNLVCKSLNVHLARATVSTLRASRVNKAVGSAPPSTQRAKKSQRKEARTWKSKQLSEGDERIQRR